MAPAGRPLAAAPAGGRAMTLRPNWTRAEADPHAASRDDVAASDPPPPGRAWPLFLLFAAEVVAVTLFQTPGERFTRYAYGDSGADLVIPTLTARGLRPGVDFGYIYGLLPLALNRAWFAAAGATPAACRLAKLACELALAWGLARYAKALRVGAAGAALIAAALPDMVQGPAAVLVHALEPALLVNALALQARGRRGGALALATACLFVKPSMAYIYGLVLLAAIFADGGRRCWRALAPAAALGLALAAGLAALYGVGPLLRTLAPGAGAEVYRQGGYGFFRGAGRAFWLIPGGGLRDYFRYEVGSWLIGTAALAAAGVFTLASMVRRRRSTRADEMVITCAGLHTAFVVAFFGHRASWVYYYPVWALGLAAVSARGRRGTALVMVLSGLVLLGGKVKTQTAARLWRTDAPSAQTWGLWASPAERSEWEQVRALAEDGPPAALLANVEGAATLDPAVYSRPEVAYLVPGHPTLAEVRRKAAQLASAATVVRVRPRADPARGGFERWPEIAAALDGCEPVWQGEFFEVSRRVRPPGRQRQPPE